MAIFFPDEIARALRKVQDIAIDNILGVRAVLYRNRDDLGLGPDSSSDVDAVDAFYNKTNLGDSLNYDPAESTRVWVDKGPFEQTEKEEIDNEDQDPIEGLAKPSDQISIGSYFKVPFSLITASDLSKDTLASEGEIDKVIRLQVVAIPHTGIDNTAKVELRFAKMRTKDLLADSDTSPTADIPSDFFTD